MTVPTERGSLMSSNIAIDQASGRPYAQAGADQATLIEDPGGRGCYLIAGSSALTVDHSTLDRSIDGGTTWERVADQLPTSTTVTDPECLSAGVTLYRITAISALPSSAVSIGELDVEDGAMWLTGGDAFTHVVRLPYNPTVKISTGLVERVVQHFAGRTLGVEMTGTARQRTVTIGSLLVEDDTSESSSTADVEALSYLPAPILYRDPDGRRIYTSLTSIDIGHESDLPWTLSASLEEVSRD